MAQNRDIISLTIDGRIIKYTDKIWKDGVQFIPKDPQFMLKLIASRNRIPYSQHIMQWVNEANSGKNLEEYEACGTEEELAEMVRRDCKLKGLIEVKV